MLTINPKPVVSTRKERDDLADQIYQQLKEGIVLGIYRPGDLLPTISEISTKLQVSPRTVQTAFTALANDNLIESARSLGTRVLGPTREARKDIAQLWLTPIVERLRRLGLEDKEAKEVFDEVWSVWFGSRRGDRRNAEPIRTMTVEEERRTGAERRDVKTKS